MPRVGKFHAVILAGGAGERFWPASRQAHPKPFLKVAGGETLLGGTLRRARRFAGSGAVWVVCGRDHAKQIRAATGLPANRVLIEPMRRNTAMAVGFAAQRIIREDPGGVMAVLPADHLIPDAAAFADAMRRGAAAARSEGVLVTLGVKPTRPDTGYGYIQVGRAVGPAQPGMHAVKRFVEKPQAAQARRYLRAGSYLWNAGIFVWTAAAILEEMELHVPDLFRALAPLGATKRLAQAKLRAAYHRAPSEPIDTAVMERSRRVWTLPVDFHWSDVGTWESLADELGVSAGQTRVLEGDVVHDDLGGNLVWVQSVTGVTGRVRGKGDKRERGRAVALLGVEGLAVIDTGDALLVTRLDRAADVREVVRQSKARGRADVT